MAGAPPFRFLANTLSGEELEDILKNGLALRHRPPIGVNLTPPDAMALLAYLRSLAAESSGD